ncbi:MAG: TetR/AcrR family transcriptional regulator [Nitrosomonas sp.]|nr:MAG: TetR/AcrR family transcriptional regulator [Nitrosomonas sp.]
MKKSKLEIREAIVDTAVAIAERSSWEAVRLFDIAAELNISLDDIRLHFREKEDLIDAWFDRADNQMLREAESVEFLSLSPRERLQHLIMSWLDTLAAHRKVTRQMIGAKFEPGHLHIQIPAIMRISRTVQWMREAAHRDATFVRRALEETALTTIYLATFTHWMRDESENSQRTRDFLAHKLAMGEKLDRIVYGAPRKETPSDSAADTQSSQSRPATIDTLSSTEPIVHQMRAKSG